jgi:hypothetical protein
MTIAKGVRVVVVPSPPMTEKRGKPRKYVGAVGTVCKLNGSGVLLDMGADGVAWVRKKFLEPVNG